MAPELIFIQDRDLGLVDLTALDTVERGGPGSGYHDPHYGIPGKRGGSLPRAEGLGLVTSQVGDVTVYSKDEKMARESAKALEHMSSELGLNLSGFIITDNNDYYAALSRNQLNAYHKAVDERLDQMEKALQNIRVDSPEQILDEMEQYYLDRWRYIDGLSNTELLEELNSSVGGIYNGTRKVIWLNANLLAKPGSKGFAYTLWHEVAHHLQDEDFKFQDPIKSGNDRFGVPWKYGDRVGPRGAYERRGSLGYKREEVPKEYFADLTTAYLGNSAYNEGEGVYKFGRRFGWRTLERDEVEDMNWAVENIKAKEMAAGLAERAMRLDDYPDVLVYYPQGDGTYEGIVRSPDELKDLSPGVLRSDDFNDVMILLGLFPIEIVARGGPGSGHRGHEGRQGEVGGSLPDSATAGRRISPSLNKLLTTTDIDLFNEGIVSGMKGRKADELAVFDEAWIAADGTVYQLEGRTHDSAAQEGVLFTGLKYNDKTMNLFANLHTHAELVANALGWLRLSGYPREAGISFHTEAPPTDEQVSSVMKTIGKFGGVDELDSFVWEAHRVKFNDEGWIGNHAPRPPAEFGAGADEFYSWLNKNAPVTAQVLRSLLMVLRGGPGSGHHGHEGRPGEVGGSLPSGVSKFYNNVTDAYSGQINGTMYALDAEGNKIGYIDWVSYGGEVSISMIEVNEEHRRKGIATAMWKELQNEFPEDRLVQFGDVSTEAGRAFMESMASEGTSPVVKVELGSSDTQRLVSDKMKGLFGETPDLASGAWIGPNGEGLAPFKDHQFTASSVLEEIDPSLRKDPFSDSMEVVGMGLVRHTEGMGGTADANVHGFTVPEARLFTPAQREAVVSIMVQKKGADSGIRFVFSEVLLGRTQEEKSFSRSIPPKEIGRILKLETDFWDLSHQIEIRVIERGGPGSGHRDHEGRPGEVGGSLPSGQSAGSTSGEAEAPASTGAGIPRAVSDYIQTYDAALRDGETEQQFRIRMHKTALQMALNELEGKTPDEILGMDRNEFNRSHEPFWEMLSGDAPIEGLDADQKELLRTAYIFGIQSGYDSAMEYMHRKLVASGLVDPKDSRLRYGAKTPQGTGEWVSLPETLYHVTTAADAVRSDKIKSRFELGLWSTKGLGGGEDDTISFSTDLAVAQDIDRALHEGSAAARGDFTIDTMVRWAAEGKDAPKPYLGFLAALAGGHRSFTDEQMAAIDARVAADPTDIPEEVTRIIDRFKSHDEEFRDFDFYQRYFGNARQHEGGPTYPLFWGVDKKALAESDPSQFTILEFNPAEKAMGYQMGGLGEWRTVGGENVQLVGEHETMTADDEEAYFAR